MALAFVSLAIMLVGITIVSRTVAWGWAALGLIGGLAVWFFQFGALFR
jgi:hypothetical protein